MAPPSLLSPSSSFLPITSKLVDSTSPPTSTSSHAENPSNPPLPPLPIELKKEILRFCDPATLAKTSLVSLAFLEMSSPILYDEVEVVGFLAMSKLFCTRNPLLHQPHLEPFLSLHQIRRFTFTNSEDDYDGPNRSLLSRTDRLLPAEVLSVESLTLRVRGRTSWSIQAPSWPNILSLFDPTDVICAGVVPTLPSSLKGPIIELHRAGWPSLRRLTFRSCTSFDTLASSPFLFDSPGSADRVVLTFELANCWDRSACESDVLGELDGEFGKVLLNLNAVKQVVVRVSSIEEKEGIEGSLLETWEDRGSDESLIKKWRSRLRFEVVEDDAKASNVIVQS